jgi:cytochrome P450
MDDMEARLDERCRTGEAFSLDLMLGQLTADVICRTVFSTSLANDTARDVFESFSVFERSVAHVELRRLIFDKAFTAIPQSPPVLDACERIRRHIGVLVDHHLAAGATFDDIAASIIGARDPRGGAAFTREELIDQLGVFFLAGHETTASALTWAVFIAAMRPEVADRMEAEARQGAADAPITFDQTRNLTFARNVFRETLRLYPPITFLPRVALKPVKFGRYQLRRGSMVMIAPWVVHRHSRLWKNPHAFDPDRFLPEREHEMTPGAYIPFGIGRRVCVGAAFATTEASLILGRLMRRYRFTVERPERVRPVARLTTRPAEEVMVRIRRVGSAA